MNSRGAGDACRRCRLAVRSASARSVALELRITRAECRAVRRAIRDLLRQARQAEGSELRKPAVIATVERRDMWANL